jgi:signal transduction histidine kinase
VSTRDAEERAARLLEDGGDVIGAELESALTACRRALDELQAALEAAGESPDARFDALRNVRRRHGLSGLQWEGADGRSAWSGRTIVPRSLPAPHPWKRSFSRGRVTYHGGPFVRALVMGPVTAAGGTGHATWILEELGPEEVDAKPFASRWLEPLELWSVELLPPTAAQDANVAPTCCRHVPIAAPDGDVALVAALRVHDLGAMREQLASDQAGVDGVLLLLLLAGAVVALIRFGLLRIRHPVLRWLTGAVLVLFVRGALRLLELPERFPPLRQAFSPSEFAVDTPLGWLASPGDFTLSACAYLLLAICFVQAARHVPDPRAVAGRVASLLLGIVTCGLVSALWLRLVDVAVGGGQTPFFQAHAFIPGAPAALMLTGLVAVTATTYLLADLALRRAVAALAGWPGPLGRPALALAAAGATWLLAAAIATPHWIVVAVPLLAAAVAGRGEGRLGLALPSRVLVLSVLATALAYPVLWNRVADRENASLEEELEHVLASEDIARAGVAAALADARADVYLRERLQEATGGSRPEGLALYLWLRAATHWQRQPAIITMLDGAGRSLDEFALETLPPRLLPPPRPPAAGKEDEEIFVVRGGAGHLRCVVGRLRLRGDDERPIGHVVITVPDAMDLRLKGLARLVTHSGGASPLRFASRKRLQYAALEDGRVVASSDPSLSRSPAAFGPPALATLGEERMALSWSGPDQKGYARYDAQRSAVFAVRQPETSLGDALLALARLVVVGVGLGLLTAVACLLAALGSFRLQLQHKILLSYFVISVIPLVLLGIASARETQERHDLRLSERLETDVTRARGELELMGTALFDSADSQKLEEWAPQRRHDTLLYRDGELEAASRPGLVTAELLSRRLPAPAYRATVLEGRQLISRRARYAGRRVWFAFAPVLDGMGRTRATVGVPLLYEADRVEQQVTLTGSVLLAAYMLTLVLVLVGGIYVARRLTQPLGLLARGTKRVSAGDLDVELEGEGADELGQLVAAFNTMTRDLREATKRAAQAEREMAWRRMASQVAHEIKNPLTPMRLMLQQMEADVARDPESASAAIARTTPLMLRQIEGLDRIARDFANFARLPKRSVERVDVAALVEEVTALHSGAAGQGIEVRCEVAGDLPPVYWDAGELRRVLLNMVLNAVESIEGEGHVVLQAAADTRAAGPGVRITVTDDGAGIPPEHIERLFEPQFSTKTRGTGLGLAIVSRILRDMGGEVRVRSVPGEGSTFELWWPTGDSPAAGHPQ